MPTAIILRFCICSLLVFTLVFDSSAQRTGRRRAATVTNTKAEEKVVDPYDAYAGWLSNTVKPDSSKYNTTQISQQTEYFLIGPRAKKKFSPSDLVAPKPEEKSSDQLELSTGWGGGHVGTLGVTFADSVLEKLGKTKWESTADSAETTTAEKYVTIDCKETNGINIKDKSDSYPYLTADGLRLYFTSNREGGHGRFFISTRKSINDPFTDPKVLSKNLTDGYYAGTLTADELTLCMVKEGGVMYISVRSDKNSEFPSPVKVEGTGNEYHFGPSISQDGSEIFITVRIAGKDMTRIYKRTGTYIVEEKGKLILPEGYDADPGQLSKDGLTYYLSMEGKNTEHLWKYTRTSTADNFSNPVELPEQMKGLRNSLQPSMNGDGTIMVFVISPNNGWDGDDILLVNSFRNRFVAPKLPDSVLLNIGNTVKPLNKISSPQIMEYSSVPKEDLSAARKSNPKITDADQNNLVQLKVYPNPFVNSVIIQLSEAPAHGAAINIYDQSGKIIRQQNISKQLSTLSLDRLLPGIYTYQVVDDKGKLISSGNLVKGQ